MKHYAIVLQGNTVSEDAYRRLQSSTTQTIMRFDAVTPDQVDGLLTMFEIQWNYPWDQPVLDIATGLNKSPYPTKNRKARIACALSHYTLWQMCSALNEPIVILEHDAIFLKDIDFNPNDAPYDVIGINDPRGATRRSADYHNKIQLSGGRFLQVPWIDDQKVPQGLAGNSAYIIKPQGAKNLKALVKGCGLWPNDAIMCRQLIPNIGVTKTYYTKVQGTRSTTTQ